jgi:hypothetical protein
VNHPPFTLTPQNKPFLISRIEKLDPTVQWEVVIRQKKSKRTLEQNSRLWDLYGAIGDYLGEDKDAVHELMGYKFLRELKTVGGETVETIKSTTKLNTKQMAEYQENIERWAAGIGFVWEREAA